MIDYRDFIACVNEYGYGYRYTRKNREHVRQAFNTGYL